MLHDHRGNSLLLCRTCWAFLLSASLSQKNDSREDLQGVSSKSKVCFRLRQSNVGVATHALSNLQSRPDF